MVLGIPNTMLGLAALAIHLLFSLVWRAAVHRRKTGSFGMRLDRTTTDGRIASLLMIAGHALAVVGAFRSPLPSTSAAIVGAAVFATGLVLVVWAQSTMGDSWRIGVDPEEATALVTEGPFTHVRNPIFSGMAICLAGIAILSSSLLGAVGAIVFVVGVELQVRRVEEPYLRSIHGRRFDAYLRRVGRFVPRVGLVVTSTPR